MSRLCLDTSAYSQYRRGHSSAVQAIDAAEWVGMPVVVLGELWAGFLAGGRTEWNQEALKRFLSNPAVEAVVIDHDIARLYGEIFFALKHAGTPIPVNHIWVAACAARYGATILTFDSHFHSIRRVGAIVLSVSS